MNLRPYQSKDLAKLRAEMKAGARRLLFEATCVYGKSLSIETIAHAYVGRTDEVLVLSNRTAVVDQLTGRAKGNKHINVSRVQGIVRRLDKIPTPKIILVDEAHMGGAAAQIGPTAETKKNNQPFSSKER